VRTIESYAFCGCTGLKMLTIPSTVETLGFMAFCGCTGLSRLTIQPGRLNSIGIRAFQGCCALTKVGMPSSLTKVDSYAFCNCTSLIEAALANVTEIGIGVFFGCGKLTTLSIRTDAGAALDAFAGVTKLEHIELSGGRLGGALAATLEKCLAEGVRLQREGEGVAE
jgi:hypothetical protein